MGNRSRIRWENVAKLGAGGAACLALAAALPGMLRRPEPPPLEPDVGFASATDEPPPSPTRQPGRHRREGVDGDRRAAERRPPHEPATRRSHPPKARGPARHPSPHPSEFGFER
jgi:hypothetical protein